MKPIDIVVTYCNSFDEEWNKNFSYYKNKEIKNGNNDENNEQAFNPCRTRNWGFFKYWFRCVEENCEWVNNVFLVVQSESQVPSWINRNYEKLKIVYHDEFIPAEFLPTFNALTIQLFLCNIKELSENYILCDDDCFFIQKIENDHFFTNEGVPIGQNTSHKIGNGSPSNVWEKIQDNNLQFEIKHFNTDVRHWTYHFPVARLKSFERNIINQYRGELYKCHIGSKFRADTNISSDIFADLLKITNTAIIQTPYEKSKYYAIMSWDDFSNIYDYEIVCLNDTETSDFSKREEISECFEKQFSEKSKFEE